MNRLNIKKKKFKDINVGDSIWVVDCTKGSCEEYIIKTYEFAYMEPDIYTTRIENKNDSEDWGFFKIDLKTSINRNYKTIILFANKIDAIDYLEDLKNKIEETLKIL